MLRPRMILVIAVGLLMTLASIVLRYQVTHHPIEEEQHTIVRPRALPAVNHNERIVETTVPDIGKTTAIRIAQVFEEGMTVRP